MKVHRISPDAGVPAGEKFFVGEVPLQLVVPCIEAS